MTNKKRSVSFKYTSILWIVATVIVAIIFYYTISYFSLGQQAKYVEGQFLSTVEGSTEVLLDAHGKRTLELFIDWSNAMAAEKTDQYEIQRECIRALNVDCIAIIKNNTVTAYNKAPKSTIKEKDIENIIPVMVVDGVGLYVIENDFYMGYTHEYNKDYIWLSLQRANEVLLDIIPWTDEYDIRFILAQDIKQLTGKEESRFFEIQSANSFVESQSNVISLLEAVETVHGETVYLLTSKEILPNALFSPSILPFTLAMTIFFLLSAISTYYFIKHFLLNPLDSLRKNLLQMDVEDGEAGKPTNYLIDEINLIAKELHDMTNRLQDNHNELKEMNTSLFVYSKAMDATLDEIALFDRELYIEYSNPAFQEYTDLDEAQLLGRNLSMFIDESSRPLVKTAVKQMEADGFWRGEISMLNKDGSIFVNEVTISPVPSDEPLVNLFIMVKRNIHEEQKARFQMMKLSHHDTLTGLANRVFFMNLLEETINHVSENSLVSILYLDIDNFKYVNDSYGHIAGDLVIKQVGERLIETLSEDYLLARFGGDEFSVLATGFTSKEEVNQLAQNILALFEEPFYIENDEIYITIALGSATYPADGKDMVSLIKHADEAMYKAKDYGRNVYVAFEPSIHDNIMRKVSLESSLQASVVDDFKTFFAYYQPKLDTQSLEIIGLEALMRWKPVVDEGFIPPNIFIPIAEEAGFINQLTKWMIYESFRTQVRLKEQGFDLMMSVNISASVFSSPTFLKSLKTAFSETGMAPNRLDIEITESMLLKSVDKIKDVMVELQEQGITITVDDFGTGYSSLGYLHKFHVNRLKIDNTFVRGIPESKDNIALIEAIVSMAKSLQIVITAEGVETKEQYDIIKQTACEEIQGFLVSKAVPYDTLLPFLEKWEPGHFHQLDDFTEPTGEIINQGEIIILPEPTDD